MASGPQLSSKVIRDEALKELRRAKQSDVTRGSFPRLVAFYGQGSHDELDSDEFGKIDIVPVSSELELRAELPPFLEEPRPTAYLVPWQHELPSDIAGRFVQKGRVIPIGPGQRLMALASVKSLDPGVERSKLAAYLLEHASSLKDYRASSSVLTMNALCSLWLSKDWGLHGGELAPDTFLAWAATNGQGPSFAAAMGQPAAKGVQHELAEHLQKSLGVLGTLALDAWATGKGTELMAYGILCEAFAKTESGFDDAAVRPWLSYRFAEAFPRAAANVEAAARALSIAAGPALRYLSREDVRNGGTLAQRSIVAAAEALIHDNIRDKVIASSVLPTAWALREQRLGAALAKGAAEQTVDHARAANECLLELERHDLFRLADGDDLPHSFQRGEMAVRLLTWLVTKGDRLERRGRLPHSDAEELAQWYVREGGYVDWARHRARGGSEGPLTAGIEAVLAQVDALRDGLDERFAQGLAAWHEADRPSTEVIPIDKALERIALPFLKANTSAEPRRLLVLLMDGMAWAQAVELLQSMAEQAFAWGPLQWHAGHRVGSAPFPPVFANLPTVTEVSRSAFFASKPMKAGAKLNSEDDPEHFASNSKLQPFCSESRRPRLLLRAEAHAAHGGASQEALSLIRDKQLGVVGIVVNAIDKSLSADIQQATRWRVKDVKSLPALLDTARAEGRYVLFCSDHGHVPADRFRAFGPNRSGPGRYRPFAGEPDAQPGEVAFSGTGVYAEKDMRGAILLTTDRHRYRNLPNAGEHGGASLAEVLAPCLLIGWAEPGVDLDSPELGITRPGEPSWWHRTLPARIKSTTVEPVRTVSPTKKPKISKDQLGLPGVPAEPAATTPSPMVAAPQSDTEDPFVECEMLKARETKKDRRVRVARVVRFLLERNSATIDALAQHLDIATYRIESMLATFTEALNVDGYEVLRFDRRHRQIYLDKEKLIAQFGAQSIR